MWRSVLREPTVASRGFQEFVPMTIAAFGCFWYAFAVRW
jgi:hypothetical protein